MIGGISAKGAERDLEEIYKSLRELGKGLSERTPMNVAVQLTQLTVDAKRLEYEMRHDIKMEEEAEKQTHALIQIERNIRRPK